MSKSLVYGGFRPDNYMLVFDGLNKVEYTNNDETRLQNLFLEDEFDESGSLPYNPKIGLLKKDVWKFESEWRYKIKILCIEKKFEPRIGREVSRPYMNLNNTIIQPNDLFFKIDDLTFTKMRIRLGPRTSIAEQFIIEALISKFNKNAIFEISKLEKIIR